MIELRMPRLTPPRPYVEPGDAVLGEAGLAFSYLYIFRRVIVGLAVVGAVAAFIEQMPGLCAAMVTIAIGELLESSYYISVLRWRQRSQHSVDAPARQDQAPILGPSRRWEGPGDGSPYQSSVHYDADSVGTRGRSRATSSITSAVARTPRKTA